MGSSKSSLYFEGTVSKGSYQFCVPLPALRSSCPPEINITKNTSTRKSSCQALKGDKPKTRKSKGTGHENNSLPVYPGMVDEINPDKSLRKEIHGLFPTDYDYFMVGYWTPRGPTTGHKRDFCTSSQATSKRKPGTWNIHWNKWLFQLGWWTKSWHGKWVEITISIHLKTGCLEFQEVVLMVPSDAIY